MTTKIIEDSRVEIDEIDPTEIIVTGALPDFEGLSSEEFLDYLMSLDEGDDDEADDLTDLQFRPQKQAGLTSDMMTLSEGELSLKNFHLVMGELKLARPELRASLYNVHFGANVASVIRDILQRDKMLRESFIPFVVHQPPKDFAGAEFIPHVNVAPVSRIQPEELFNQFREEVSGEQDVMKHINLATVHEHVGEGPLASVLKIDPTIGLAEGLTEHSRRVQGQMTREKIYRRKCVGLPSTRNLMYLSPGVKSSIELSGNCPANVVWLDALASIPTRAREWTTAISDRIRAVIELYSVEEEVLYLVRRGRRFHAEITALIEPTWVRNVCSREDMRKSLQQQGSVDLLEFFSLFNQDLKVVPGTIEDLLPDMTFKWGLTLSKFSTLVEDPDEISCLITDRGVPDDAEINVEQEVNWSTSETRDDDQSSEHKVMLIHQDSSSEVIQIPKQVLLGNQTQEIGGDIRRVHGRSRAQPSARMRQLWQGGKVQDPPLKRTQLF